MVKLPKEVIKKNIKINWIFPKEVETKFSNNLVVHYDTDSDVFHLSFFEIKNPLILETEESERIKKLESINSVDAICISSIVVSSKKIGSYLNAIKNNVEKHTGRLDDD